MRKPYQSPGQDEKLILLYSPGRGLNSRPPAHRSFKHGKGVPRPKPLGNIGDYIIPPVKCVRDLGVVFDHHMTMHDNITKTCASCYTSICGTFHQSVIHWLMRIYHTARSRICVIPNWLLQLASVWNTRICHQKAATGAKLGCPCCHAFVKDADAEEIALAACEVSHNIQSSAAYIQGTARHGTKLLENSAAKLHAFSLTDIRDWKFTHHAESTPQIRVPYFRLCGSQVVERTTCEH